MDDDADEDEGPDEADMPPDGLDDDVASAAVEEPEHEEDENGGEADAEQGLSSATGEAVDAEGEGGEVPGTPQARVPEEIPPTQMSPLTWDIPPSEVLRPLTSEPIDPSAMDTLVKVPLQWCLWNQMPSPATTTGPRVRW